MRYSIPIALSLTLLISSSAVHAASISQGAMLSNSCSACHGTDGKSPGAIPSINGKSAQFINQALTDFRSGNRTSTVMGRHAKGYSDKEIKLIADYFASLK
jgi:sulfide dehydrogenase cytochrome subunit